jgi:3-deoxy-7-phosphoheptulonate synthase
MGLMLESFLVEGSQQLSLGHRDQLTRGQSITDACLSWETTSTLLENLARAVSTARTARR